MNISINTLSYQQSIDRVIEWAKEKRKAYICFANVHMSVEAYRNQRYAQIINKANLVLPDGKPIAIVNSWLNKKSQERISGMDFLESLLHQSHPVRLFIYGSTEEVIAAFAGASRTSTRILILQDTSVLHSEHSPMKRRSRILQASMLLIPISCSLPLAARNKKNGWQSIRRTSMLYYLGLAQHSKFLPDEESVPRFGCNRPVLNGCSAWFRNRGGYSSVIL